MNDPLGLFEEQKDPLGLFTEGAEQAPSNFAERSDQKLYDAYKKTTLLNTIPGIAETIAGGVGELANAAVSGLYGPVKSLFTGDTAANEVTKTQEQIRNAIPYSPETESGKAMLDVLGIPVDLFNEFGGVISEKTGSPAAGAVANTAGNAVMLAMGAKGKGTEVPKAQTPRLSALDEIQKAKKSVPSPEADPLGLFTTKEETATAGPEKTFNAPTIYASEKGVAAPELATKITESPEVTDQVRIKQQQELEQVARQAELPKGEQLDLFKRAEEGEQIPMDYSFLKEGKRKVEELRQPIEDLRTELKKAVEVKELSPEEAQAFFELRKMNDASQITNNGSGESSASLEAQSRLRQEQALGQARFVIKPDNTIVPLKGVDAVDYVPKKGEVVVQRNVGIDEHTILGSNGVKNPEARVNTNLAKLRNQQGSINLKEIGDGLKALGERISAPFIKKASEGKVEMQKTPAEVLGLGVHKETLKDYITEDPTPKDIIAAAKTQEDSKIGRIGRNTASGSTFTATKTGSALIQGISRLFLNATKRAELAIRNIVYPVEHTFKSLPRDQIYELGEVFKREMFSNKEFDLADLEKAGFTDKQIKAYSDMRSMFNKTWEKQNQARIDSGMKPITKREAYLSSRWHGDWHIPVYDKEGKLAWYIAETTKIQANKALKYLQKNYDSSLTGKVEFKGGKRVGKAELQDAYLTMLKLLDENDPRTQALKSVYEDGVEHDAYSTLGQSKHFEPKSNIRGFIGDRPWRDAHAEAYRMFKEQFAYAKNAHNWAELQSAVKASKEVLSDPELQKSQPNNMAYAQQYAKNKLGFGENQYINGLENQAAGMLGTSKGVFNDVVGGMKTLFLLSKLGLNLGFATVNKLQPFIMSPAWHVFLSEKGFKNSGPTSFAKGLMDSSAGFLRHLGMSAVEHMMTPLGKEAMKYAEDNGIVSRDLYDESANLGRNKVLEAGQAIARPILGGVEHSARLDAFMSFVHHLDAGGAYKGKPLEMFQHAEELTNNVMGDYRAGERPMMFDKMGLLGDALATLQTFKFNYYNQLHFFSQEAVKGNWKPLATFLGIQALVGGAMSFPFMTDMDSMWEQFKKILPDSVGVDVINFGVKKWLAEHMNDWAAYGGVSKITGANMTSRFDPGSLADYSFDALFPFITDATKQLSSFYDLATNPNATTAAKAAYAIAPPGPAQGMLETQTNMFKGQPNEQGNTPYQSPASLEKHNASYVRTPTQEAYRNLGLRELEEAKYRDQRFRQQKDELQIQQRQTANADKIYDAIVRKDMKDVELFIKRYVNFGGDPNALPKMIEQNALAANVPRETIEAMKAQTLSQIQKTLRMKKAVNDFNH